LPSVFDDYLLTNATVHGHNTRSRLGLNAVSYRTNVQYFLLNWLGRNCGTLLMPIRKCSPNAFKTVYEEHLISFYHWYRVIDVVLLASARIYSVPGWN